MFTEYVAAVNIQYMHSENREVYKYNTCKK